MSRTRTPRTNEFCGLKDDALLDIPSIDRAAYFRQKMWERDRGICGICGQPVACDSNMHLDHITPVFAGGQTDWDNLRVTHATCNRERHEAEEGAIPVPVSERHPRTRIGRVRKPTDCTVAIDLDRELYRRVRISAAAEDMQIKSYVERALRTATEASAVLVRFPEVTEEGQR